MNVKRLWAICGTIMGLLIAVTVISGRFMREKVPSPKLRIVTTLLPYQHIIEKIGGEVTSVWPMIPAGRDPHIYEPSPRQLARFDDADIYIKIGADATFEKALLGRFLSVTKDIRVYDSGQSLALIDQEPHVWFSTANLRIIAKNITKALSREKPAKKAFFWGNYQKYMKDIDSLDQRLVHIKKHIKSKTILVYHPVMTYFSRDLGFRQISIEYQGKEPGPRYIVGVIQQAAEQKIKKIFLTPEDNVKTAQAIAREIDGKIVYYNPLNKDTLDAIEDAAVKISS